MFAEKAFLLFLLYAFVGNNILETNADDDLDSVKIMFFHGPTSDDYEEYNLNDARSLLKHPKFIHNQTHCFMPAYRNWKLNPGTLLMANAYLKRNTSNFLNIEWEKLANGNYTTAQQNVLQLSPRVADFIIDLFKSGLSEDTFSMSGQSMGARGIAVIARDVIERSNGTMLISRITPLDPSNEEAHDVFILPEIKPSFAKFVDIIHTDAGGIGTRRSMGHADFWFNNGTAIQPGCPKNDKRVCSHSKACAYFAETVANGPMLAYPSGTYDELLNKGVESFKDKAVVAGIDCPWSARGNYFLQHNTTLGDCYAKMPYKKGIYCNSPL